MTLKSHDIDTHNGTTSCENSRSSSATPAMMETHKKNMRELKMGSDHATVFFQKLEREAKLAGRQEDTDVRGMMVTAVQQGVPQSFTRIITDIGLGIPTTYNEWKEQILIMYEEQERNKAYNQMHGLENRDKKPQWNQKQITTTSSKNTTGGATSSSTGKTGGDSKGRDTGEDGQHRQVLMQKCKST